jgi:hypothetical protein
MKSTLRPAALALALAAWLTPAPVQAAGCLKGATVGGVAGHFAGHHGLFQLAQGISLDGENPGLSAGGLHAREVVASAHAL